MGGIAAIARQLDHQVSGADQNVYPPMSTQLENLNIEIYSGYGADQLAEEPDQLVVGNVMTRGMPVIEAMLKSQLNYMSGPEWLNHHVLRYKKVYSVAGTHGKTTTSSMLAWILEDSGINPGFLIGGVCQHFEQSARLTDSDVFVIEADEYDSAFFDKRSKFVHYRSDVVILNNLEFDHADIFEDIHAIKKQFHHLIRTIPEDGCLIVNHDEQHLQDVLEMGCWTPVLTFGKDANADYWVRSDAEHVTAFDVMQGNQLMASIDWHIPGEHNQLNALAAMLAAQQAGVDFKHSAESLSRFQNVKRRMELVGVAQGVTIYDDFAHHPTAIQTTILGAQKAHPGQRIVVVLEPRSNSMRAGVHAAALPGALKNADLCLMFSDVNSHWDQSVMQQLLDMGIQLFPSYQQLLFQIKSNVKNNDVVVFMSNGGFGDLFKKLYSDLLGNDIG